MKKTIPCFLILVALILWEPPFLGAQAVPDTTHLLEQAGVNPNLLQTSSKMASTLPADQPEAVIQTWDLPFASTKNRVELIISNTTGSSLQDISIRVAEAPDWITFESSELSPGKLDQGAATRLAFRFDVEEEAPVSEAALVRVQASSRSGGLWSKTFRLQVSPPSEFELLSNYPNPFNPSTTIAWRLPSQMHVTVNVYNVMGQKVATLADGVHPAGQHHVHWEASGLASGLYFYRVAAAGTEGERSVELGKMLLIK